MRKIVNAILMVLTLFASTACEDFLQKIPLPLRHRLYFGNQRQILITGLASCYSVVYDWPGSFIADSILL